MPDVIDSFTGQYAWLSNFYEDVEPILFGGYFFPTAEHAFQAAKSLSRRDWVRVSHAATPGEAKRLGRRLELREDWEDVKLDVMRLVLEAKFRPCRGLGRHLTDTGNAYLVEGNNWGDTYWGAVDGVGQNHLGKLLMERRDLLRILR